MLIKGRSDDTIDLNGQEVQQLYLRDCHRVSVKNFRVTVTDGGKAAPVVGCSDVVIEDFAMHGAAGLDADPLAYLGWDKAAWLASGIRALAVAGSARITARNGEIVGFRGGVQMNGPGMTMEALKVAGVCGDALRGYGDDLQVLDNDVFDLFKVGPPHVDGWQGSEHRGQGPFHRVTIRGNRIIANMNNIGHPLAQTGGQPIFQKAQAGGIVFYDVVVEDNVTDSAGVKAITLRGVDGGIVRRNVVLTAHGHSHPRIVVAGACRNIVIEDNVTEAVSVVEGGTYHGIIARRNRKISGTALPDWSIGAGSVDPGTPTVPDDDDDDGATPPPTDPDDPETPEPPEVPETPEQPPAPDLAAARAALAAAQVKITEALGAIS